MRYATSFGNLYDHEAMRFNTMSEKALWNRLDKITHKDKLDMFVHMAKAKGLMGLAKAAEIKLKTLIKFA
jgi:hypothetical protein